MEQSEAREILQGKNLMPYLNKSDRMIVHKQFRKIGHMRQNGRKFDYMKNMK